MKINWFPGHMAKSLRMLNEEVKDAEVIIYVLDARAPLDCLNPELNKIIENKPVLFVINKIDLADPVKIKKCEKQIIRENSAVILLDSTASGALKSVLENLKALCRDKIEKSENKGIKPNIRAIVVGVPNSGKSTLINNLCGKAKTVTGNKPGVTRGKQWISMGYGFQVLDTPGTLYPSLTDQKTAKHLAYIGSIRDEILNINELACEFIGEIKELYPNALKDRYNIEESGENYEILEKIAIARKFLLKKSEVDYDRAAACVIDDFRSGRLGKITF